MAFKVEYAKFNTVPPNYQGAPQATLQNPLVLPNYNPYFKTNLTGILHQQPPASQYRNHPQYDSPQYNVRTPNNMQTTHHSYTNSPEYNDHPHTSCDDRYQSKYIDVHHDDPHQSIHQYNDHCHDNDHLHSSNDHLYSSNDHLHISNDHQIDQTECEQNQSYSTVSEESEDKENTTDLANNNENQNGSHTTDGGNLSDCRYGNTGLLQFPNQCEYSEF